jgi:hypothetical protein
MQNEIVMTSNHLYEERLSSKRTEALFIGLTIVFLMLFIWRISTNRFDILSAIFVFFFLFFFFYSVNYRILTIRLSPKSLTLTFGIFKWAIPLENIEGCRRDDLPIIQRYGGAGIHFMFVGGRYRASFNFLEFPRVVIALKKKAWIVRDVSFSTSNPGEVLRLLHNTSYAKSAG